MNYAPILDYTPILFHIVYGSSFQGKQRGYGSYARYASNLEALTEFLEREGIEYVHVMQNLSERNTDARFLPSENAVTILTQDSGEEHRMFTGFGEEDLGETETHKRLIDYLKQRGKPLAFAGEYVWAINPNHSKSPCCLTFFIDDYILREGLPFKAIKDHVYPLKKPKDMNGMPKGDLCQRLYDDALILNSR